MPGKARKFERCVSDIRKRKGRKPRSPEAVCASSLRRTGWSPNPSRQKNPALVALDQSPGTEIPVFQARSNDYAGTPAQSLFIAQFPTLDEAMEYAQAHRVLYPHPGVVCQSIEQSPERQGHDVYGVVPEAERVRELETRVDIAVVSNPKGHPYIVKEYPAGGGEPRDLGSFKSKAIAEQAARDMRKHQRLRKYKVARVHNPSVAVVENPGRPNASGEYGHWYIGLKHNGDSVITSTRTPSRQGWVKYWGPFVDGDVAWNWSLRHGEKISRAASRITATGLGRPNPGPREVDKLAAQFVREGHSTSVAIAEAKRILTLQYGSAPTEGHRRGKRPHRNPSAASLSESFHGRPVEEVLRIETEERYRTDLAKLGQLIEIVLQTQSGYRVKLNGFGGAMLTASPDAQQMYMTGGDQRVDLKSLHINGNEAKKDLVLLGDMRQIVYRTEKAFDKLQTLDYEHRMAEEGGTLPVILFDRLNSKILFGGGSYKIRPEGIVN